MAGEKTADAVAVSGGNRKKLALIGAAAAVVAVALAVAAWFLLGGKHGEEGAEAASAPVAAPAAIYASLGDKFVVTLQEDGRQRYFQTSLSALTRDQAVVKALELHAPLIRGRLVTLLGEQDFVALRTDWWRRWPDVERFYNRSSDGVSHCPGWSKEVLALLLEED